MISIGWPLSFITPLPNLQWATAIAVFYNKCEKSLQNTTIMIKLIYTLRPKAWTEGVSAEGIFYYTQY